MCTDFYNLGLTHMIVDPGVRVAYDLQTAQQLYTSKVIAAQQHSVHVSLPKFMPY